MRNWVICVGIRSCQGADIGISTGDALRDRPEVRAGTLAGRSARWQVAYSGVWPAAAPEPGDDSFGVGGEPAADAENHVGIRWVISSLTTGKAPI
jgi:hypothetical protein